MSNPTISPSIPLSAQSTTSAPPKFTTATANPQPQPLLYAHPETLRCATHPHASKKRKKDSKPPLPPPGCVACTYKLLKPDVSLDTAFTAIFPNVRPEMCPRCSNPTTTKNTPPSPMDKALGDSVLTVGDGDLTFSFALRQSLSASTKIHASSYETLATLLKVYGSTIPSVISTVGDSNVSYSVDATKLRETLTKASPKTEGEMYSSIIWNFPCTAEASGQDGQNTEMEQNKELLRGFVKCASAMLKDKGVVVLTHKTKPPYNHWKIVDVVEGVELENENRIICVGRICFDKYLFPGYTNRKALDKKSFTCHDAEMYFFRMLKEDETQSSLMEDCGFIELTEQVREKVRNQFMIETRK